MTTVNKIIRDIGVHCRWCGERLTDRQTGTFYCKKSHATKAQKMRKRVRESSLKCPTPLKVDLERGTAIAAAQKFMLYAYPCRCGCFHLTKTKYYGKWAKQLGKKEKVTQ